VLQPEVQQADPALAKLGQLLQHLSGDEMETTRGARREKLRCSHMNNPRRLTGRAF